MRPLDPIAIPLQGVQLIEASAGTGKTYTITTLYLRLLLERQLDVRQILVVTFTRAATEELRTRIRQRIREVMQTLQAPPETDIAEWLQPWRDPERNGDALALLQQALLNMDEASIFTIHGFCQRALQDNAFESGLLFDLRLQEDLGPLLQQAAEDTWRKLFYPDRLLAELAQAKWGEPADMLNGLRSYLAQGDLELIRPDVDPQALSHLAGALKAQWRQQGDDLTAAVREAAENKILGRAEKTYREDKLNDAILSLTIWSRTEEQMTLPPAAALFSQSVLDASVLKKAADKGLGAPQHAFFTALDQFLTQQTQLDAWLVGATLTAFKDVLQRLKTQAEILGFDDLIGSLKDALAAATGPQLRQALQRRYPVALIDEFQDTDPSQYRIFSSLYDAADGNATLFMIGDPKQAIYSFRGADIYAYLQAKQRTPQDNRYTMDTNWRSRKELVAAVNGLFEQCANPFLFAGDIEFIPVQAAGAADASVLTLDDVPVTPLQAWLLGREDGGKTISKDQARPQLAQITASEIANWLNLGECGRARLGERPLSAGDIAVLVRDNKQARIMSEKLSAVGVSSVFLTRESVYQSEEATDLLRLLRALLEPNDERRLRAALVTLSWGWTAAELETLARDEQRWENMLTSLHQLREEWQDAGFMPMFQKWLQNFSVAARLLGLPEGERRLTNLLQLAELLQQAGRDYPTPERLLAWYQGQLEQADGRGDEHQLRLESDEALVKIVTIHSSKGLEYPLVFLPFLGFGRSGKDDYLMCHDPEREHRLVLDLSGGDRLREQAERERLAEDLRLLYVALTRAKQLCVWAWGAVNEFQYAAMAWLLYGGATGSLTDWLTSLKNLDDTQLAEPLTRLAAQTDFYWSPAPEPVHQRHQPGEGAGQWRARSAQRTVEQNWRLSSYSQLAAGGGGRHSEEPLDEAEATLEVQPRLQPDVSDIFQFPKGAWAGQCFHHILENMPFQAESAEILHELTSHSLQQHGFGEEWVACVAEQLWQVVNTPLRQNGVTPFSLSQLDKANMQVEMEFLFPVTLIQQARLARFLADYSGSEAPVNLNVAANEGLMHGFIDLTFQHEGRFYIADYKGSWLGEKRESYAPDNLRNEILAHRYDLQYLIYTLALHRYLQRSLPAYDYETHFGGVYYLFLRGMHSQQQPELGVFFDRPSREAVAAFAEILQGEPA
ncbi:exodeoxyribonuclease V, beta subunit [Hahella chejuensis KCTC 2396]|uniref:RecBCD enzyme subunit RecB n=1 Tax=Hahella chejuensis (strain KCTC 2396) TaxID=349521 RepID=Q2SQD6_HAHCH|nr:exodeoxyribonuclease V subunit beta [Hahella chejuensis]ABC27138.1 exodeoxyribonuclease V, beta subunit [Hahella chejuensis KCTC 2396]